MVVSLIAALETAGVRLVRDGDDLIAEYADEVNIEPFRKQIVANKPALIAALTPLYAEIVMSEARRRSAAYIARRIASIEACLGTPNELPGHRLSLRYWEAIAVMRARTDDERRDELSHD